MKRLVFIVTHGITANLLLRGQLSYLRDRGFDITVIASPGADLDEVAARERVSTVGIPMSRSVRLQEGPRALAAIRSTLRQLQPDIVNASTSKAGLLGMLAARSLSTPRRIYLVRGLRYEGFHGVRRRILSEAERVASQCATDVVCVSGSVASALTRAGLTSREKVTVIPSNGIGTARFRPKQETRETGVRVRAERGIPADAFVAGFVGRLTPDKGVSDMLDALEMLPDAWLLLVGGDAAGDTLPVDVSRRLRAHPRIARVGHVPDPAPYYAAMDALLFPSYREGLPNVPLEAGACEVPCVGYSVTGVIDAVENGVTGILVTQGQTRLLANALRKYMVDVSLRTQHGRAARARVLERFTSERVWLAWARLYGASSEESEWAETAH